MSDLISRQTAIDAFERFIHELGIKDEPYNYGEMALSVQNVPSVENKGEWIPVSERLPEKNDVYLVAVEALGYPRRDVDGFIGQTPRKWEHYGDKVVAWMPLPEPYKA